MNSASARWSERSRNRISLARHSCFTERTQRSANAFRFGLRCGSRRDWTRSGRQHFVECGTEFGVPVVQHVTAVAECSGVADSIASHCVIHVSVGVG